MEYFIEFRWLWSACCSSLADDDEDSRAHLSHSHFSNVAESQLIVIWNIDLTKSDGSFGKLMIFQRILFHFCWREKKNRIKKTNQTSLPFICIRFSTNPFCTHCFVLFIFFFIYFLLNFMLSISVQKQTVRNLNQHCIFTLKILPLGLTWWKSQRESSRETIFPPEICIKPVAQDYIFICNQSPQIHIIRRAKQTERKTTQKYIC